MRLACDAVVPGLGCDYVAVGETEDDVHGDMMRHGDTTHGNLLADKAPEEVARAKQDMDGHIRRLIAEHN